MSCSTSKFLGDREYLLEKVEIKTEDKDIDVNTLRQYIRQNPNTKWFSLFKIPMATYSLSGTDSTKWINRTLRNIGEEPVLFDSVKAQQSVNDLTNALNGMGYMHAKVNFTPVVKGKKLKAIYTLYPGEPYKIHSVKYIIEDSVIEKVLKDKNADKGEIQPGDQFNVNTLDKERQRITEILNDEGYLKFNKHFILYEADSFDLQNEVDLRLRLVKYKANSNAPETLHPRYTIGDITYRSDTGNILPIRRKVLENMTMLEEDSLYRNTLLQRTYNRFGRMGIVKYTNIQLRERPDSSNILDCDIQLGTKPVNSISFQPEGTNTAGDLGAAVALKYENRNLFHGSELWNVEARAAYEAIRNLSGYDDSNYIEFNLGTSLTFPRFLLPFISKKYSRRVNATSELAIRWDMQNRPEFHRRVVTAGWRYKWNSRHSKSSYQFDLLDVNYIYMPWISETFKNEYLDNTTSSNSILRFNYQNLFITKIGFRWNYVSDDYVIRTNVETSGNLLHAWSLMTKAKQNDQGEYTIFNIAYAQYAKGDFDITRMIAFNNKSSLALHARIGIAYPYGNSKILPFEKRYFSGGANSLRGWSVRSLGPGAYKSKDGNIDFINQTGDMKLDLNAEFRMDLFWKLGIAAFIDAGNIWTLRYYEEQDGGQFKFNTFYKQIAASYGIGFRLNFNFFVLRFDMGMKAINPAYDTGTDEYWAIVHPKLSRDFAFHFAVGLPF